MTQATRLQRNRPLVMTAPTPAPKDYSGPAVIYELMYWFGNEVEVLTTPWEDKASGEVRIGIRAVAGDPLSMTVVCLDELTVRP